MTQWHFSSTIHIKTHFSFVHVGGNRGGGWYDTISHHILLYHMEWYEMISYQDDIISYIIVSYGMIWYDMISYDTISCDIISYDIISTNPSYHNISHHIKSKVATVATVATLGPIWFWMHQKSRKTTNLTRMMSSKDVIERRMVEWDFVAKGIDLNRSQVDFATHIHIYIYIFIRSILFLSFIFHYFFFFF